MDDSVRDKLVKIFGKQILSVGHERPMVLNIACTDGFVTNERLRSVLNIHKAEIADLLKDMCCSDLLIAEGRGRGTKYRLPDFVPNMATSVPNMATSALNMATSVPNMATSKKKMNSEEFKELIKSKAAECISLEELAVSVNRSHKYLRTNIIPRLMEEGVLEMLFPGIPNHPRQKYKSIDGK